MSLAILFHFLCAQHVSDINISIIRSLRLCRLLQPAKRTPPKTSRTKSSNTQRTENKTSDVVIHQHSRRKLLMMDILITETCWAHKKWNKIASDIKLVFHSSTIKMMHGPINIRNMKVFCCYNYTKGIASSFTSSPAKIAFWAPYLVHIPESLNNLHKKISPVVAFSKKG